MISSFTKVIFGLVVSFEFYDSLEKGMVYVCYRSQRPDVLHGSARGDGWNHSDF